jgi:hypothetical protein
MCRTRFFSNLPLLTFRLFHVLVQLQGFANPTRPDRRFFQARLRELVAEGVIERVAVPNHQRKGTTTYVKCLRLVSPDTGETAEGDDTIVEPDSIADDGQDIGFEDSLGTYISSLLNSTLTRLPLLQQKRAD